MAVKHWNTGASAERYRQENEPTKEYNNMTLKKVNWYDEELDKFYDTKKDNDGFIYGIYGYDGEDVVDVQWFKSEIERDQQASKGGSVSIPIE